MGSLQNAAYLLEIYLLFVQSVLLMCPLQWVRSLPSFTKGQTFWALEKHLTAPPTSESTVDPLQGEIPQLLVGLSELVAYS